MIIVYFPHPHQPSSLTPPPPPPPIFPEHLIAIIPYFKIIRCDQVPLPLTQQTSHVLTTSSSSSRNPRPTSKRTTCSRVVVCRRWDRV